MILSAPCEDFFQIELRKILISGELSDDRRQYASQNIVKERLTRKIFRNKGLASRESCVPSREFQESGTRN